MPTKQFYATGDFRYGTRMLRAGDPVQLDGPNARLFSALGKITDKKPRAVKADDILSINDTPFARVAGGETFSISAPDASIFRRSEKATTKPKRARRRK